MTTTSLLSNCGFRIVHSLVQGKEEEEEQEARKERKVYLSSSLSSRSFLKTVIFSSR